MKLRQNCIPLLDWVNSHPMVEQMKEALRFATEDQGHRKLRPKKTREETMEDIEKSEATHEELARQHQFPTTRREYEEKGKNWAKRVLPTKSSGPRVILARTFKKNCALL